jgi:thymidylate kinase
MTARRVVALEGLPFTGKSSAALNLKSKSSAAAIIPDYHELIAPDDRARMAKLSDSTADQQVRIDIYRRLDDRRWDLAGGLVHSVVVFDRCYVSIAAYRLALQRTFGTTRWGQSPDRPELSDTRCERSVPREILYFQVDLEVAVDRHRRLSTTLDPQLRTPAFLSSLIDAYGEVLKDCGSQVVSIDSNEPLDVVVDGVQEYVHSA